MTDLVGPAARRATVARGRGTARAARPSIGVACAGAGAEYAGDDGRHGAGAGQTVTGGLDAPTRAAARPAPRRALGVALAVAGGLAAGLLLHDTAAAARPAALALVAVLAAAGARRPLGAACEELPSALRGRLRHLLDRADRAEVGLAALVAALVPVLPAHFPLLATGLAGFLLMGALARLTLSLVLRRALAREGTDDRDHR
jgi:hypothetical protein